jgi:galacturan 1,4-alpha-galacturonidase
VPYWQENHFYYDFQKSISFWRWGGHDVRIFGRGTLNGNGQRWYNEFAGQEILVFLSLLFLFRKPKTN